jgi:Holliday junction resolvase
MNVQDDFWDRLSTYETLQEKITEFCSEADLRIEKAQECILKCQETLRDLDNYLKRAEVLPREPETMQAREIMLFTLERAKDYLSYWRRNLLAGSAELDLMKKLLDVGIDSRYSGRTTAIDVFAKFNDKIVLIQVKSTNSEKRSITAQEIRDLLQDSLFFEKYPVIDIAFYYDQKFDHFFVPIEEIMANLMRKSISLSRNRVEKIMSLDFPSFEKRLKECDFPIMKFDKTQFESWINKLE